MLMLLLFIPVPDMSNYCSDAYCASYKVSRNMVKERYLRILRSNLGSESDECPAGHAAFCMEQILTEKGKIGFYREYINITTGHIYF